MTGCRAVSLMKPIRRMVFARAITFFPCHAVAGALAFLVRFELSVPAGTCTSSFSSLSTSSLMAGDIFDVRTNLASVAVYALCGNDRL